VSLDIIDTLQSSLFGTTGNYVLIGLGIMLFFFIGFIILGIPFKYSLMFIAPMILGFVEIGWFPQIISFIFWLLIAGIGIFLLISQISDR
jgi:hypothetical protein